MGAHAPCAAATVPDLMGPKTLDLLDFREKAAVHIRISKYQQLIHILEKITLS